MAKDFRNWFDELRTIGEELEPLFNGNCLSDDDEFAGTGLPEAHFKTGCNLFSKDNTEEVAAQSMFNFGFEDKGDHYELVTNLGGNGDVKEDAVKVKLEGRFVQIIYEHRQEDENSSYSYSQRSSVLLPKDADKETLAAHFNDDNNVVVLVDKEKARQDSGARTIQITR